MGSAPVAAVVAHLSSAFRLLAMSRATQPRVTPPQRTLALGVQSAGVIPSPGTRLVSALGRRLWEGWPWVRLGFLQVFLEAGRYIYRAFNAGIRGSPLLRLSRNASKILYSVW